MAEAQVSDAVRVVSTFETVFQGGTGRMEDVLALLHPEVVVHECESVPYPGDHVGHEGFLALTDVFGRTWSFPEPKSFTYLDAGDGRVVVSTLGVAESRATGRRVEWRLSEHFQVVDGLITDIRPFYFDTAALRAAITP